MTRPALARAAVRGARLLALCTLVACRAGDGVAPAMVAAARGEPGARGACLDLADVEAAGDCLVTWLEASPPPLDAAVCAEVSHTTWRSECYFVVGESRLRTGDVDGAIEACRSAGSFREDCVGHLYREAVGLGSARMGGARARIAAAFPTVRPPEEEAYAVEREMFQAERLRAEPEISLAACAAETGPEAEVCTRLATGTLRRRWERRAEADARVKALLCGATGADGLPDLSGQGEGLRALRWVRAPALDDAVREARSAVCGAGG